ncbi:YjcZ family sporulation protein [Metabacillus fastidiosus]
MVLEFALIIVLFILLIIV